MSVINNSRSLLKSIDALNCKTSKSSIKIKNTTLNTNKTEHLNKIYETLDQPTDAIDYYSFSSDTNEMYYSDSEGSKLLVLPQCSTYAHNMPSALHSPSSSDSEIDYCKIMNNKPLATSSPLSKLQNNIKNKYYWKKTSKKISIKLKISNDDIKSKSSKVNKCYKNSEKTISSYTACSTDIPNLFNKTASPRYNNPLIDENQDKTDKNTKHISTFNNVKQISQKTLNDVTNILHTNQSQITLHKSSFTTNMTLNKKSKNNTFQLNLLSDETVNSNPNKSNNIDLVYSLKNRKSSTKNKIEENQTLNQNTTIISNNSQITYNIKKHTTFDEKYLNNTDLSDIFQMELSLKMFSGTIVPYLNSMKHEILQIINKCMYKPDEQIIKRSKHVNDIIKNIHHFMRANMNNCFDSLSNKKDYATIPFVDVDLNNLNVLNNKLECINKKLEQVKFPLCENIFNYQEDKSADQFNVQNDLLEFKCPDDLKSYKPITDNANAVISSTKTAALDSFSCIRELHKSNSLLHSISDCVGIDEPSHRLLENRSLICTNELPTNEISKTMAQDLSYLSYKEFPADKSPLLDKLQPINNNLSSNFEGIDCNYHPIEKNQSRYWLRNNPKSTEHYFSPFPTHLKTPKKSCIKSKYNDMFICKGSGSKKVFHHYKLKSVLKADSDEFMKIICPESKNKKFKNDNQNTTVFDISNLKPKKKEKLCRCGIFPSQVPFSWNESLHTSLHKNLHKLQFKSQVPVNIASKINFNGLLFNIIKVTENSEDSNLRLTLKNIQDFIQLEIDFSKKSIDNLNYTIFLAVDPKYKVIGYLEIEPLTNACIYQNSQLSKNLIAVKYGISKLWVMVKYRNNGVATKLLEQFCDEENLKTNDIAFAFHGNYGISFIKKYFANNSVLIY